MQRQAVSGEVDFFEPFGNANDGQLICNTQTTQALHSSAQLPFSPVDNDQLRQRLTFLQQAAIASVYDLLHGSKIIGAFHRLHIIVAVIFFAGFAVLENDAGTDRVAALDIGVIETLEVYGQHTHAQVLLQLLQNPLCRFLSGRTLSLRLFALQLVIAHILFTELQQLFLVAYFRHHHFGVGQRQRKRD